MNLFKLINLFRKTNGRSPSPNELAMLKRQVSGVGGDNVIQFPGGDKSGIKSLDEFTRSENIYEQSMKPKGEGTLKFEEELNVNLYGDETFEELMQIKDTGKHPRDKAAGGRIGFFAGGAKGLLKLLQGKLGKKTVKMADDVDRPQSALNREMFDEANKRFNKKVNERTNKTLVPKKPKPKTPDKALLKAMDEIGGGTGDLKYDADVLADELAFQRGLIPEGGDITDIADQMKRMDLYDEAYSALSQQFLKNREIKKMQQFSKPTETLKSIKEKGTMDISDPNIADEFDTFLRENNPEDYKNLEQKIQLDTFDTKGRKKNAVGGLAHMLGEGPRSMYGYGGGAGMPPVTHDDNVDNIGPGTMNPGSRPRLNVMPQMRPGKYMENKMNQRPMQNLANGGRISFAGGGGLSRRAFLKLLGAGTATAAAAKTGILGLLKGKKAATGIKVLSNTTTTMPAWFPDLVDKMMVRGIGKKIDQDLMEYTVKDLPNVKMAKSDDGKILLEGQNEYGRPYAIEYEPPGYELLDEATGKSVRTKGDFRATDVVPESGGRPDDVPDFFPEQLDSVDDILSSDARVMEEFATGQKVKNIKQGESSLLQAEQRLENSLDDIDDFAKGGLAKLLGE
jgi:hypothetical protein